MGFWAAWVAYGIWNIGELIYFGLEAFKLKDTSL